MKHDPDVTRHPNPVTWWPLEVRVKKAVSGATLAATVIQTREMPELRAGAYLVIRDTAGGEWQFESGEWDSLEITQSPPPQFARRV